MESRQRKRFLIFCLYLILAVGCATTGLEQRVARLETQVEDLQSESAQAGAGAVGATSRYGRTMLTGTVGQPSVDNISESGLADGDVCIVRTSDNYSYEYRWDASNNNTTNPEVLPKVIVPNTTDGTGAWILQTRVYSESFYSSASDGEHYIDVSNSGSLPTSPPEGALSVRDDYGTLYISDSAGTWWPIINPTSNFTTSQNPLAYILHWNGTVTNYGATGYIQHTLRKAVLGMEITFPIVTAQPVRVDPNSADKFIGSGFTDGEYYWADGVGEYLRIKAVKNGAGATDIDWAIVSIGGIWTQQTPP